MIRQWGGMEDTLGKRAKTKARLRVDFTEEMELLCKIDHSGKGLLDEILVVRDQDHGTGEIGEHSIVIRFVGVGEQDGEQMEKGKVKRANRGGGWMLFQP